MSKRKMTQFSNFWVLCTHIRTQHVKWTTRLEYESVLFISPLLVFNIHFSVDPNVNLLLNGKLFVCDEQHSGVLSLSISNENNSIILNKDNVFVVLYSSHYFAICLKDVRFWLLQEHFLKLHSSFYSSIFLKSEIFGLKNCEVIKTNLVEYWLKIEFQLPLKMKKKKKWCSTV